MPRIHVKVIDRPFVAIDGEGITDENGEHYYTMLVTSSGESRVNPNGLSSLECLEFLLSLEKGANYVAFAFTYDATMILRDITRAHIGIAYSLWLTGRARYRDYSIEFLPRKWLAIRHKPTQRSIRIYDVFGFFQTSFVNAIKAIGIDDDFIREQKANRANFDISGIDETLRYCREECRYLVRLMDWLRDAFKSHSIPLRSWHGPGAVADAVMRRENVKRCLVKTDELPDDVRHAVMSAYYGGRAQTLILGHFGEAWQYDINSAYPTALLGLPDANGKWVYHSEYVDSHWSVWLCAWEIDNGLFTPYVSPFPWRNSQGGLRYPATGSGYYWNHEVSVAIQHYAGIDVRGGYVFHPASDTRPFSFVRSMYESRLALKAVGNDSQIAIKLGLNSLYGKLAQGVSYNGKTPAWQCHFWAGNVTSHCRATLLRMAQTDTANIVSFATDSIIYADRNPQFPTDETLGGLSLTEWHNLFVAQQGMYHGYIDGKPKERTRSFVRGGLDWTAIREGWDTQGVRFSLPVDSNYFMSLGLACSRNKPQENGRWGSTQKALTLKTPMHPTADLPDTLYRTMPDATGRIRAIVCHAGTDISAPYKGKIRSRDIQELMALAYEDAPRASIDWPMSQTVT